MFKNTLMEAVQAGAVELKRFYNNDFNITYKEGINNPVTEADHASEAAILKIIKANFPDHQVLAEEMGEIIQDSSYKWIIDPIDGTINFAHGIPLCCVIIALEKDGEIICVLVVLVEAFLGGHPYIPVLVFFDGFYMVVGERPFSLGKAVVLFEPVSVVQIQAVLGADPPGRHRSAGRHAMTGPVLARTTPAERRPAYEGVDHP